MTLPVPTSMDAPAHVDLTGASRIAYLARGVLQIIGVGVLAPVAILVVGLPIVLVVRLLVELGQRW